MYTHPGDDMPSPGTFSDLVQMIREHNLTPGRMLAVVADSPHVEPFNGPRAVFFDGVSDDGPGPVLFRTMAFPDHDTLLETLHAAGIHVIVDSNLSPVAANAGPAAGEPDAPKIPAPETPEALPPPAEEPKQSTLDPPPPPDDEVIVAGTTP